MLQNIIIENFRGIEKLEIKNFKRVNLFTGKNNSGKTSVLEAIFFSLKPYVKALIDVYAVRSLPFTATYDNVQNSLKNPSPRWQHMFGFLRNNGIDVRNTSITTTSNFEKLEIERTIVIKPFYSSSEYIKCNQQSFAEISKMNSIRYQDSDFLYITSRDKTLNKDSFFTTGIGKEIADSCNVAKAMAFDQEAKSKKDETIKYPKFNIFYIPANVHNHQFVKDKFNNIKNDDFFKKNMLIFLKKIDNSIKAFAFDGNGDIEFELENETHLNFGLAGDGIKKIFSILCMIYECRNGVLLTDEIDNGMHFSIQKDFWQIVLEACEKFNVQLFATTHSGEMIEALNKNLDSNDSNEISKIFSISRNRVFEYDEKAIEIAIDNDLEVR